MKSASETMISRFGCMAVKEPSSRNIGVGVALGAGVGAALFAATSSPVWIGVGVAIGAALGAASSALGDDGDDSEG